MTLHHVADVDLLLRKFFALLAPGGHLVETSMKGYETDFRTLVVGDSSGGETIRLKPATAAVLVQSEPAGAVITRDGVNLGFTPMLMPEVPFGAYRVELSLAGYKPQQIELVVAAASPQKIATRLVSSSAALDITSDPPGAAVSVKAMRLVVVKRGEGKSASGALLDRIPVAKGFNLLKYSVTENDESKHKEVEATYYDRGKNKREEAADQLLAIIRKNRGWNDEAARKQLVQFFEAWGPMDENTIYGRRRLSSILFS